MILKINMIRSLILCGIWSVLICENGIAQKTSKDIIIEREVYEKVKRELALLDSIQKENQVLQGEIESLKTELNSLSGEIGQKEKSLTMLNEQVEENIDITDDLVYELRSQIKLLNIAKKEQKELLRKYKRRRWTQGERRTFIVFAMAVLGMSITIAVSNLTQ